MALELVCSKAAVLALAPCNGALGCKQRPKRATRPPSSRISEVFACNEAGMPWCQDEWPICSARYTPDRQPVLVSQPATSEARLELARRFVDAFEFQIPMLVDPIHNPFDAAFAPWPLRFYILQHGRLAYKAQPRDCGYDLAELRSRLLELLDATS